MLASPRSGPCCTGGPLAVLGDLGDQSIYFFLSQRFIYFRNQCKIILTSPKSTCNQRPGAGARWAATLPPGTHSIRGAWNSHTPRCYEFQAGILSDPEYRSGSQRMPASGATTTPGGSPADLIPTGPDHYVWCGRLLHRAPARRRAPAPAPAGNW